MGKLKYDLQNAQAERDFETWLTEHGNGYWMAGDGYNCPYRAFVRDMGYNPGWMGEKGWDEQDEKELWKVVTQHNNPAWAEAFVYQLDHTGEDFAYRPFPVNASDCLAVLHKNRAEREKNHVSFPNDIPANH